MLKQKMDDAIKLLHVQPVGNGYFDCICPMDNAIEFIDTLSKLGVRITGFSWWCHVTQGHTPCGMGGPKDRHGNGWYSEIEMCKTYDFNSNAEMRVYLSTSWKKDSRYKPCYVPAFCLDVPPEWENTLVSK